jgi:hypothetical protein
VDLSAEGHKELAKRKRGIRERTEKERERNEKSAEGTGRDRRPEKKRQVKEKDS